MQKLYIRSRQLLNSKEQKLCRWIASLIGKTKRGTKESLPPHLLLPLRQLLKWYKRVRIEIKRTRQESSQKKSFKLENYQFSI